MLKIRHRHDHRIHILAIEQRTIIARGGNVGPVCFLPGFLMHGVEIRGANALARGHLASGAQQVASADARADGYKADLAPRSPQGPAPKAPAVSRMIVFAAAPAASAPAPRRTKSLRVQADVHFTLFACSAIFALRALVV